MQKSIWKLVALAGVVGIGSLGVMQAQRGLTKSDNETAQEKPFEDFDSTSEPDANDEKIANADHQNEIGFGQTEPTGAGSEPQEAAFEEQPPSALGSEPTDPGDSFAQDAPFSAEPESEFTAIPRRKTANESDEPSRDGGLDFRTAAVPPENNKPKPADSNSTPATPVAEDDPFGSAPDAFEPQVAEAPSSSDEPETGADEPFGSKPEPPVVESPTEEPVRVADLPAADEGPAVRQTSEVKPEPEPFGVADPQAADDPFATEGPRLFAPATNARPMSESKAAVGEPAPVESDDVPRKIEVAEGPQEAFPQDDAEMPFKELPRFDEAEGEPKADAPPLLDELTDDEKPTSGFPPPNEEPRRKAAETEPAGDSPFPDPGAFGEDVDTEPAPAQPKTTVEDSLPVPDDDPFADTPVDPMPVPETEPVPERESKPEPPAVERTPRPTRAPEPLAAEEGPQPIERKSEQPQQLQPQPKAVRLVPPADEDLAGDATVAADSPSGPQRPQLSIVKQAPPNAVLGQPMIYSIIVKNVGASAASKVTVEDRIPRGTRLTGTIPQAEMFKKTLIWKLGTLEPNQQRKIQVRIIPHEAGQVGSIATVNFVAEVASRTIVTSPSLKLDLSSPQTAGVGGQVTLNFKVINNGTSNATGIVLRSLIPEQLSHPSGKDLEYEVGDLAAGESKVVNLRLTAAKVGQAVNKAVVTADGNLTAEAAAPVKIVGPQLKLSRRGPNKRYLGRPATFTNRVTNTSGTATGPVTIVESVPAGLKFVRSTHGGQYNEAQRTVAWQIERLAAGESKDVGVELVAIDKGAQESVVTAAGPEGISVRVQSRTYVTGLAALNASLTGITGPTDVGDTVTLKVRVANRGNQTASGVKVQLVMSEQLTFVTSDGPAKPSATGNTISFPPFQAIGPQQEQTVTVVLRAKAAGEARVNVQIDSDQLSRPLTRDDALVIVDGN